jgi:hypothetical protein
MCVALTLEILSMAACACSCEGWWMALCTLFASIELDMMVEPELRSLRSDRRDVVFFSPPERTHGSFACSATGVF